MKKYLPALLAVMLSGMMINTVYAADSGDVDDVTMDVIDHSDPHAVTKDIVLPDQASQVAKDHVAGTVDDSGHAQNASEETNEDSHATAEENTHSDAQEAASEDANEAAESSAEESAGEAMEDAHSATDQTDK